MVSLQYIIRSGVNFINIKRAHFLYERLFSSYVLALKEFSDKKFPRLTLMKLTAEKHRIPSTFAGFKSFRNCDS